MNLWVAKNNKNKYKWKQKKKNIGNVFHTINSKHMLPINAHEIYRINAPFTKILLIII